MNYIKSLIILTLMLLISACSEVDRGYSFANPNSPQSRAIAYFEAIYNKTDLKEALTFTTQEYSNAIAHYVTAKSYARNVLNLKFDKGVEINIDRSLNQVKQKTGDSMSINVLFTGEYLGDKVVDVKRVQFVKDKESWLIDGVLAYN